MTDQTVNETIRLMFGYYNFYDVPPPNKSKLEGLVRELMEDDNPSTQFIAKDDQIAVGFVTLYEIYSTLTADKVILMNDLYVEPQFRGNGFGKALFETAVKYTKENDYPKMEWMTEPANNVARRFYDNMGAISSEWIYYSLSNDE